MGDSVFKGVTDLNVNFGGTGLFSLRFLIMYSGQLVFAQLIEHLPLHTFRHYVRGYPSKYPIPPRYSRILTSFSSPNKIVGFTQSGEKINS